MSFYLSILILFKAATIRCLRCTVLTIKQRDTRICKYRVDAWGRSLVFEVGVDKNGNMSSRNRKLSSWNKQVKTGNYVERIN
jgi:hypothetical protein